MPTRSIEKVDLARVVLRNLPTAGEMAFDTGEDFQLKVNQDGHTVAIVDTVSSQILGNKTLSSTCDIAAAVGIGGKGLIEGGGLPPSQGAGYVLFDDGVTRGWATFHDILRQGAASRTIIQPTSVQTMHTTPVSLVAAGGSGTVQLVSRITFSAVFSSVAYAGTGNIEFRYNNATGAKVTTDIAAATLQFTTGSKYSVVVAVTTELTPVANAPIVAYISGSNPTSGDSPITFSVEYLTLSV